VEIASQTISEPGELPEGVDLWSLSPNFSTRQFKTMEPFSKYANGLAERSAKRANLIVWIGIRNFADMNFWYPSFDQWIRHGVILSGSGDRTMMGIVFSNTGENRWNTKIIWSEIGGERCSQTCRWVVRKSLSDKGKLVCDPYAKSYQLASWCRRFNLEYRGYTGYQRVRAKIEKELAQTEIPGIQEELPLLMKNGE
jgi:hypothetical protein